MSVVRLRSREHVLATQAYEDNYYLPPASWLPVVSLGHQEALADLLWMRSLVYFGEEMVARAGLEHVFDYADAVLALDPDFRAVYHWIGMAGLYQPVAITPDEVHRTLEIQRRGLQRFPDDGELAWSIGATLAFELPPLLSDDEARDAARTEGADYLAMASRLGAAPEWAVLSNASMLARVGRAEAAARHLEEMYATVRDEAIRAEIADRIAALRSDSYARAFAAANQEEELARLRELPYVDPDLYFLIGPRSEPDWRQSFREGHGAIVLDADDPLRELEDLE